MNIRGLDPLVAQQVVAGGVVDRPASVVKELLENALDAGASRLEIEVGEDGASRILVRDDDSGMSPEDVKLSILRHATSKINSVEDLESVNTLGFRGEALPSIASVSSFSLSTATGEGAGTKVTVDGGASAELSAISHPKGTTVLVERHFYNVAARRAFLKGARTERAAIVEVVSHLAVSHPLVGFRLSEVGGRELLSLPTTKDLRERLAQLYGVGKVRDFDQSRWSGADQGVRGSSPGGRCRIRRPHSLSHRRHSRHLRRPAPRRPAAHSDYPRRREPRQRRNGHRRLPDSRGRGRTRNVLAVAGWPAVRNRSGRRGRRGLAMGWVVIWVRRHVADDPNVQNTISLLTPFATYLLAEEPSHWAWEQLGFPGEFAFSGVLAVVTAGLYLGRRAPYVITPETRLQGYAFWELVTFLLNGVIFALIGLQLGGIVERLSESTPYSVVTLVFYGALISLAVILARFMWIFLTTYVRRWLSRRVRQREPTPPVRQSTAGERGHRARSQKPERFIEDFRVRVLSGVRRVRGDNPGGAESHDGSGGRLRPHGGALAALHYESSHLPRAINLPYEFVDEAERVLPDKRADIVVYCMNEGCEASREEVRELEEMGYRHVLYYLGGKEDLPVEGRREST